MSDPFDVANLATHAGTAVAGGGVLAAFMRWIAGKEAEAMATRLALMEQKLDQLVKASDYHHGLGERTALLEQSIAALHRRLDDLQSPPPRERKR